MAVLGTLFFLIDGSFGDFIFEFQMWWLKRETKSLKVGHTTSITYANYVAIMSQPPWAHTVCHSCFDLFLTEGKVDGLERLARQIARDPDANLHNCPHSWWILEWSRTLLFKFYVSCVKTSGNWIFSLHFFCFNIFWKTMSGDSHSLPRIHALCSFLINLSFFFSLWFVFLFLSFHYFGCRSLFLWHENIQIQERRRN